MVLPAHKSATEVNVEALMEIERVLSHDVTTALHYILLRTSRTVCKHLERRKKSATAWGRSLRVARFG